MNPKKIKPLFFSHIVIAHKNDVQLCLKKRKKSVKSLTYCAEKDDLLHGYRFTEPVACIKVSKHLKSVQEFMLDSYFDFEYPWKKYKPHFFKLTKNISEVKDIYLERSSISTENLADWLNIWLKCSKLIKRIDFGKSLDNDQDESDFKDLAKVFKKGKLKSLNVYGDQPDIFAKSSHQFSNIHNLTYISKNYVEERSCISNRTTKIWFRCSYRGAHNGPQTKIRLMDFVLCWEYHQEPQISHALLQDITRSWIPDEIGLPEQHPRSSISDLKNLTVLQACFPLDTELFIRLLESLPDLSNLMCLKISKISSPPSVETYELCPLLFNIPKNLTAIGLFLSKRDTSINCLACIPNIGLKKLNLTLHIGTEDDIDNIINLIRTLQETQILSIQVPTSVISSAHPKFYVLLEEIFNLKTLTRIEFFWRKLALLKQFKNLLRNDIQSLTQETQDYQEENICFDFSSLLDRLFTKETTVKELKIHAELPNPNARYSFLTHVIQRGGRLQELDIDVGECALSQNDFDQIVSLLKSLKYIETLKLEGFSIDEDKDLLALAKEFCYLQNLKELKIGKIIKVQFEFRVEIVKSILSNPGIRKIIFSVSSEIQELLKKDRKLETLLRTIEIGSINAINHGIARFSYTQESFQWITSYYDVYSERKGFGTVEGRLGS